jgi:hypothetical protein
MVSGDGLPLRHSPLSVRGDNRGKGRFINTCTICGRKGFAPKIMESDFAISLARKAIVRSLTRRYKKALPLDENGRCQECSKIQPKSR